MKNCTFSFSFLFTFLFFSFSFRFLTAWSSTHLGGMYFKLLTDCLVQCSTEKVDYRRLSTSRQSGIIMYSVGIQENNSLVTKLLVIASQTVRYFRHPGSLKWQALCTRCLYQLVASISCQFTGDSGEDLLIVRLWAWCDSEILASGNKSDYVR